MLRRVGFAAVIGLALLVGGCAHPGPPSRTSAAQTSAAAPASTVPPSTVPTAGAPSAAPVPRTTGADTIPEHYDPARDPAADLKVALARAASDGREVLIDFGADWCPDCMVLGTLFRSKATMPLLRQHYHVVAVDVGEFDHNLDFAAKYVNLTVSGIPALVVLAPDGTIRVATNDGARSMSSDQVNAFLTRWAPRS